MNKSCNISEACSTSHHPNYAVIINIVAFWFVSLFGVISNGLLLRVTYRSKGMFPTQHLLAVSDFIFSFSYFTAGPPRIYWELMGMTYDRVSVLLVFLYPWNHGANVGLWWTGFLTLVLSFERFLASVFPIWYNQEWDGRKSRFYAIVYVVMVLMLVPGYAAFVKIYVESGTMFRFGGYYAVLSASPYLLEVQTNVGQVEALLCVVLSGLALVIGKRKRAELGISLDDTWIKIQKRMEHTVFAVVSCSVLLIALPNLGVFLVNVIFQSGFGRLPEWIYVLRRYFACLMVLNSGINFWLYLALHSAFRTQARIHILGQVNVSAPTITFPSGYHHPTFSTGSHHPTFPSGSHDPAFPSGSHHPTFPGSSHHPLPTPNPRWAKSVRVSHL